MILEDRFDNKIWRDWNKPWSLVLWWWAARWLVHVWVWKWLEEKNYKPSEVIGNSMWSIVWSAIALWYSTEKMLELWARQHFKKMIDLDLKWWFLKWNKVNRIFRYLFWEKTFEDTIYDLYLMAFCLWDWKKYAINEGKIWEWVRCSTNIPILFAPFRWRNNWMVDWWIVCNLPVEHAKYDQILAVSSLPIGFPPNSLEKKAFKHKWRKPKKSRKFLFEVMYRSYLAIMQNNEKTSLLQVGNKKVLLIHANPDREFKHHDFHKIYELTEKWYNITKKFFEWE